MAVALLGALVGCAKKPTESAPSSSPPQKNAQKSPAEPGLGFDGPDVSIDEAPDADSTATTASIDALSPSAAASRPDVMAGDPVVAGKILAARLVAKRKAEFKRPTRDCLLEWQAEGATVQSCGKGARIKGPLLKEIRRLLGAATQMATTAKAVTIVGRTIVSARKVRAWVTGLSEGEATVTVNYRVSQRQVDNGLNCAPAKPAFKNILAGSESLEGGLIVAAAAGIGGSATPTAADPHVEARLAALRAARRERKRLLAKRPAGPWPCLTLHFVIRDGKWTATAPRCVPDVSYVKNLSGLMGTRKIRGYLLPVAYKPRAIAVSSKQVRRWREELGRDRP